LTAALSRLRDRDRIVTRAIGKSLMLRARAVERTP
jgi:hypothetical protein